MDKLLLIPFLFTGLFCGCEMPENAINTSTKTNSTYQTKIALICNLTKVDPKAYDGWDGDCPGTDVDANIFAKMCEEYKIPYVKLENKQCTINNIVEKWNSCIEQLDPNNGLFIFFYSGHGGQFYSNDKNETDGLDETLCFWDGQFLDDNVWILLNKQPKTTRCFMVTDCCNSGSNYRLPFNLQKSKKKLSSRGAEPNLLHIGGCSDGESSYGSSRGGFLTGHLKSNFNKESTYIEWFDNTKKTMKNSGQTPTFAETGISFKTNKIFN